MEVSSAFLSHLVHPVAAETLVVHGDDALVYHDVGLEARRVRHRVCERF